jgi:hypothetical protein
MERILSTIILIILTCTLAGCNRGGHIGDISKISDIAQSPRENQSHYINAGFYVYFFELPADEFDLLSDSLTEPNNPDMKFSAPEIFTENGFVLTGGSRSDWAELGSKLLMAQAQKTKTISLMVHEGISDDIVVNTLKSTRRIFCKVSGNKFLYLKLGPGTAGLRLKIEPVIGLLGICSVDVTPVFVFGQMDKDGRFIKNKLLRDTVFESSTVNFRIRPGQFVLFGPESFELEHRMLSGTFFSPQNPPLTVRLVLLACNVIRE